MLRKQLLFWSFRVCPGIVQQGTFSRNRNELLLFYLLGVQFNTVEIFHRKMVLAELHNQQAFRLKLNNYFTQSGLVPNFYNDNSKIVLI